MAQLTSGEIPSLGQGKILVPAKDLEGELRRIQREAAQHDAELERAKSGSAAPRIRVTLANLLIVESPELAAPGVLDSLLDALCIRQPSRFFVISHTDAEIGDAQQCLRTAVSSRCVLANSGAHICSEEVYLTVGATGTKAIPNLLLSLLVPDAPTAVLYCGDPLVSAAYGARDILSQLCPLADVLLFDSRRFQTFGSSYRFLRAFSSGPLFADENAEASSVGVSGCRGNFGLAEKDLEWRRKRTWRRLIAEVFDGPRSGDLQKLQEVQLGCRVLSADLLAGKVSAEALFLAGWICSKIGFFPAGLVLENGEISITGTVDSGPKVKFVRSSSENSAEVCFRFSEQPISPMIRMIEADSGLVAEISFGTFQNDKFQQQGVARRVSVIEEPLDELVRLGITSFARDSEYQSALRTALAIQDLLDT